MPTAARKARYPLELVPFFAMQYVANAIYQNNINNYLRSVNIEDYVIGRIGSVLPIVGIAGLFLFGRLGDRVRVKNTLLIVLTLLSAAVVFCLGWGTSVLFVTALLSGYAFVQLACEPLLNTIALETLDRTHASFGPIRAVGTVSYAVMSVVAGFVIDNQYGRIIWMAAAALLLCALSGVFLPRVQGHARERRERVPLRALLRDKSLMVMIFFSFFLMMSTSIFYTYFSVYFTDQQAGIGATSAMLGWANAIGAAAEVPFLIFADRVFKKIGVGAMLLISALAIALRMTLLYFLQDATAVLVSQVLHGWGFVAVTFAMAKFINLVVPEQLKSSGQMLFTVLSVTLARSIGSLVASFVAQFLTTRECFLASAAVSAVALIVFGAIIWADPKLRTAGREIAA